MRKVCLIIALIFVSAVGLSSQDVQFPDTVFIENNKYLNNERPASFPELFKLEINTDNVQIVEFDIENIDREENGENYFTLHKRILSHINGHKFYQSGDIIYNRLTFRLDNPQKPEYRAKIYLSYRLLETNEIKYDTLYAVARNFEQTDIITHTMRNPYDICELKHEKEYEYVFTLIKTDRNDLIVEDISIPEELGESNFLSIEVSDDVKDTTYQTPDFPIEVNNGRLNYNVRLDFSNRPFDIDIPIEYVTNHGIFRDTMLVRKSASPELNMFFRVGHSVIISILGEENRSEDFYFTFCTQDSFKLVDWQFDGAWDPDEISFIPYQSKDAIMNSTEDTVSYFTAGYVSYTPSEKGDIKGNFVLTVENLVSGEVLNIPTYFRTFTDKVASIESSNTEFDNLFYPNPAGDHISLSDPHLIEKISVFDINGRMIIEENNPIDRLDLSDLETGAYILRFNINDKVINKKLIKK